MLKFSSETTDRDNSCKPNSTKKGKGYFGTSLSNMTNQLLFISLDF